MSSNVKDRILESALRLFNKEGYDAILLSDIANSLDMSRGNLSYHYRNKEALVYELIRHLRQEINELQLLNNSFPSFKAIQSSVWLLFIIQQKYSFVFFERRLFKKYEMDHEIEAFSSTFNNSLRNIIGFSIKIGNFKPEAFSGSYNNLIKTIWFICFNWLNYDDSSNIKSLERLQKLIWSLVIINFTEKGMKGFTESFGIDYLHSLGEDFKSPEDYLFK